MLQSQTVLTGHEAKSGTNQRGAWTRHTFTDQSGTKFQTFDSGTANVAFGLLNQAVVVSYDQEQNGDYTNNVLKSIVSANGAAPVAAAAPQGTPQAATVTTAPTQTGGTEAEKTARIVRMASLKIAYATCSAVYDGSGLAALENVANDLAARIYQLSMGKSAASAPQGQAAPPPSPGGGTAGAPAFTPAPAVPVASAPAPGAPVAVQTAPTGPDDDIPFMWLDSYGLEPSSSVRFHS